MTDSKKTEPIRIAVRRQREADAAVAMAEYRAGKEADLEKTARLKALRLAKEATEHEAKLGVPRSKPGKR